MVARTWLHRRLPIDLTDTTNLLKIHSFRSVAALKQRFDNLKVFVFGGADKYAYVAPQEALLLAKNLRKFLARKQNYEKKNKKRNRRRKWFANGSGRFQVQLR